jgi:regulatory protein
VSTGGTAPRAEVLARLAATIAAVEQRATAPDVPGAAEVDPLPDGGSRALTWLIRSTGQRPLTTAEARQKLLAREHAPEVVDAVLARATAMQLLDDDGFARAWVDDRGVKRGYGRARLRRELRGRGLDDATIDRALTALDDHDEVAIATEIARARAQRMPASLAPQTVAARLVGVLVRRGYDSDVAHRVARSVTALDRRWD